MVDTIPALIYSGRFGPIDNVRDMPNCAYSLVVGSAKMGKGQLVVCAYMGINSGRPQPTMVMKVGVGSASSASGVTLAERVRKNSWQFCCNVSRRAARCRREA